MESSFWIPILFKHLKPETLREKVLIVIHSLLLDHGFIPVKHVENGDSIEETQNLTNISQGFELPISSQDGGISIEILPSSWKSNSEISKLFYINRNHPKIADKAILELKVESISSKESVFSTIRVDDLQESMEFPFKLLEKHSADKPLLLELSSSIKSKVDGLLSFNKTCINGNLGVDTKDMSGLFNLKHEPFEETISRNFREPIGDNIYRRLDPLIDDKGVRGSLVGPESIIFKGGPSRLGKPKNIPISSIPGDTMTPDNDLFIPPGNNNNNYMFNFSKF